MFLPHGIRAVRPGINLRAAVIEPEKSDANLLFAILAMKMNFIRPDDLLEAMGIWFLDRKRTLGQILTERLAISEKDCDLLESMVRESQARQGPLGKLSGQDQPNGPGKPRELIGTSLPAEGDLAQLTTEAGEARDSELTTDWSDRRQGNGNDRYLLVRPHAKGGIGKVSVALDVQLNREVALKELLEEHLAKQDSRARFLLEAEVTVRLEHPGIVPVYGIGLNASGEPFYVMRFWQGQLQPERRSSDRVFELARRLLWTRFFDHSPSCEPRSTCFPRPGRDMCACFEAKPQNTQR